MVAKNTERGHQTIAFPPARTSFHGGHNHNSDGTLSLLFPFWGWICGPERIGLQFGHGRHRLPDAGTKACSKSRVIGRWRARCQFLLIQRISPTNSQEYDLPAYALQAQAYHTLDRL